jgi:hypothetical protein
MLGYLGADGFTSTFQDKLFRGYQMSAFNQMLYVNAFSSLISAAGAAPRHAGGADIPSALLWLSGLPVALACRVALKAGCRPTVGTPCGLPAMGCLQEARPSTGGGACTEPFSIPQPHCAAWWGQAVWLPTRRADPPRACGRRAAHLWAARARGGLCRAAPRGARLAAVAVAVSHHWCAPARLRQADRSADFCVRIASAWRQSHSTAYHMLL